MKINIKFTSTLAFDKVMESRAVAAYNSPLFKIPIELLAIIVSHLSMSNEDLASFALVNTDCRQLARSCQFRTVKFNGSHRSEDILKILQREAIERRQNHGHTRSLSLGACIRQVIISEESYLKEIAALGPRSIDKYTKNDVYNDGAGRIQQWCAFLDIPAHRHNDIHRPLALFVISGLVYLESLEITRADWTQSLLNSLCVCTIKHLSLHSVKMTGIVPVMDSSVVWPLETLHVSFRWDSDFSQDPKIPCLNASNNWRTLLQMCSASLKVLCLSHRAATSIKKQEDTVSFALQFPQLRQLDITRESHLDQSALESLIFTSPQMSTLATNYDHQATRELLDRRGQIRSLETLILRYSNNDNSDGLSLDFLKKNPQVKALAFRGAEPSALLERVLSLLTNFSQLRKLSMTWEGVHIPASSLDALSSLSNLEALHLSSGSQSGWRHDWPICHDTILTYLKPLRKLRRVAFTRDVYSYPREGRLFEYSDYSELHHDAWDLHRLDMRAHALTYAEAFSDLDFIHVSKFSFEVSRIKGILELKAAEKEKYSWMRSMFGII